MKAIYVNTKKPQVQLEQQTNRNCSQQYQTTLKLKERILAQSKILEKYKKQKSVLLTEGDEIIKDKEKPQKTVTAKITKMNSLYNPIRKIKHASHDFRINMNMSIPVTARRITKDSSFINSVVIMNTTGDENISNNLDKTPSKLDNIQIRVSEHREVFRL
jgi:uncharacterized protein YoxC